MGDIIGSVCEDIRVHQAELCVPDGNLRCELGSLAHAKYSQPVESENMKLHKTKKIDMIHDCRLEIEHLSNPFLLF